jgi:putative DNA methylase
MPNSERTSAPRPRIIERWFPCAEVSAASGSGWGSSNSETLLMSWFAKRPLAQSRAAVLCSLLPWPEDPAEQERVQAILREALGVCQDPSWYACGVESCEKLDCAKKSHMQQANRPHKHGIVDCAKKDPAGGYDAARTDVMRLLEAAYPDRPAEMLDPFAGRGLIPLEAARFGQQAHAIDYSPVATLASRLLIDWPFRDWSGEPDLPFDPPENQTKAFDPSDPQRLVHDIATVQAEVQRRIEKELDEFYPDNEHGEKPWGYLWASVIPCDGCGCDFPLYGSNTLRKPNPTTGDPGNSFELHADSTTWRITIHSGISPQGATMRHRAGSKKGKLAWCPREDCGHAHELNEHKRAVARNYAQVEMLAVVDIAPSNGHKTFRLPTSEEVSATSLSDRVLAQIRLHGLPGRPNEQILDKDHDTIRAAAFGAAEFGDLSVNRQNLLHATIAKAISDIACDVVENGGSNEYAESLAGYLAATLTKKVRRSTRGSMLEVMSTGGLKTGDIFVNESTIGFNYDFLETGIGDGPGTWKSVSGTPSALGLLTRTAGRPTAVQRGSALQIPQRTGALDAVVTDPPYDAMIEYSDASDLFYVWLKRALGGIDPAFGITANPLGTQEKSEEIIVKKMHAFVGDHRTKEHYRSKIAEAFAECRRVVHNDGVVSIVFGHGDPDAWRRLLDAVSDAGLVLTGAWPANTEKGGQEGSSNIQTTLTLACRPAPTNRPDGRVAEVDAEMRRVIAQRVHEVWNPSGLSYVDQKMAAAGPALEVVGRYGRILDKKGQPVDLTRYLPLARQAVTEAHNLSFDTLPLDTFDQKTRFALEWARSFGRRLQPASEARWQRLAADLEEPDTAGVLKSVPKGVRLATSKEAKVEPVAGMPQFEAALAAAAAWRDGTLADAATALREAGVQPDDPHFWACINALSKNLPETDEDGTVWTAMVRNREGLAAGIANAEAAVRASQVQQERDAKVAQDNPQMFEDPNSLFGQEGNGA